MNQAAEIQALYAEYGDLPGISIEIHKQLIAIAVENKCARATVFLQGAQIAEYQRKGEQPLLWLSEENRYQQGTALRGGIPVCWPWFGDPKRNPDCLQSQLSADAPAHGFVRNRLWNLEQVDCSEPSVTRIVMSLDVHADAHWQHPARLELTFCIGAELSLSLKTINTGATPFWFTSAFHSYLALSEIDSAYVTGLQQKSYLDTLDGWKEKQDEDPVEINQEQDRIYPNVLQPVLLHDKGWQRQITLTGENAPDLVLWNPWIDKARRLSDFSADDYRSMLCLESARVLENACQVLPGESYSFAIRLQSSVDA